MTLLISFPHPVLPVGEKGKGLAQSPGDYPVKKEQKKSHSGSPRDKKARRREGSLERGGGSSSQGLLPEHHGVGVLETSEGQLQGSRASNQPGSREVLPGLG